MKKLVSVMLSLIMIISMMAGLPFEIYATELNENTVLGSYTGYYVGWNSDGAINRVLTVIFDKCDTEGNLEGEASINYDKDGVYLLEGQIDFKSGEINFQGTEWIINPSNYSFASFSGALDIEQNGMYGMVNGDEEREFMLMKDDEPYVSHRLNNKEDICEYFSGEYDGFSSSVVVRRNIDIIIESVSDDGDIEGEAIISPSAKEDDVYGVNGSYNISGTVDFRSGKITMQGYEWIEYPVGFYTDNFTFVEFVGVIYSSKGTITGSTENGIWSMSSVDRTSSDSQTDFEIGKDTNSFYHYSSNTDFSGFYGVNDYHMDDEYYQKLVNNSSAGEKNDIKKSMTDSWGGSCYGIAATMGMVYEGLLDLPTISSKSVNNYYQLSKPINDKKLLNSIQYLQLSQSLENGGKIDAAKSMTFKRSFLDKLTGVNSGYDSLPCFLKSVVNNTKNGHVTLFGFSTKDGGHAVLITGCKYDKSKKEYKVTIFDENSANPNSIGHFSTMTISKDFKSFSYSEENLKNSTYKCMYILDWAKIKKLGTDISEGRETNKKYNYIKMPADYSCTITDEYGCILEYDGENFSGDMDIYSIDTVESDNKLYYKFSIDGSSINVSDVDSKVDVTLYNDNDFVSLSGENIDEADISVNNGINITGNDYNFNAFVSTDEFVSKNEKNLISVSADAQGETKLEKETKDVVVNSDELDNIQVSQHVATKSLSYSVASTDSFSATEVLSKHKHVFQNGYCTECGKYDLLSTIPEIKLNEEKTVNIKNENEEQYYKFSPSESGTYSICSFGDCDTYGTLYDENMNIIDYNDDGKSYNYMIEPYLNSNKTYIIGSKMYGSELGSFTIKVSKLNNDDENNDTNSSSNNSTKETPVSKANNKGSENIIVPASTEQNNSIIVTAPKLKSVKTGKKQFKATWKKVKGVVGYQIQYSTTKKFTKKTTKSAKIKKANTTSKTIKKLKSGKKYFVRIRAYKKVGDKVVYSKWSKVKKVTVK